MASVAFPMHPETIVWVKHVAQEQLVDPSILKLLSDWEVGTKKPTLYQVQELSKKIHIPFGYFFLKKRPVEHFKVLEFRTLDSVEHSKASAELKDTIAQMINIQDWMKNYRKNERSLALSFVGQCRNMHNGHQVLSIVRNTLGISETWYEQVKDTNQAFRFFRKKCEEQEILVMQNGVVGNNTHRPLSLEEFRAFALVDPFAPLIFINAKDTMGGRLFSLLHEIVHLFLGEDNVFNWNGQVTSFVKETEQLCNQVAAEILAPENEFRKLWQEYVSEQNILFSVQQIAKKFHCSLTVVSRRALDLHYISIQQYHDLVGLFSQSYQKGQERSGGNYFTTLASRMDPQFINRLNHSIQMGNTTYTEAFRLTGTNNKTFAELVADIHKRGAKNE